MMSARASCPTEAEIGMNAVSTQYLRGDDANALNDQAELDLAVVGQDRERVVNAPIL